MMKIKWKMEKFSVERRMTGGHGDGVTRGFGIWKFGFGGALNLSSGIICSCHFFVETTIKYLGTLSLNGVTKGDAFMFGSPKTIRTSARINLLE